MKNKLGNDRNHCRVNLDPPDLFQDTQALLLQDAPTGARRIEHVVPCLRVESLGGDGCQNHTRRPIPSCLMRGTLYCPIPLTRQGHRYDIARHSRATPVSWLVRSVWRLSAGAIRWNFAVADREMHRVQEVFPSSDLGFGPARPGIGPNVSDVRIGTERIGIEL
jgi:hypothetical protein